MSELDDPIPEGATVSFGVLIHRSRHGGVDFWKVSGRGVETFACQTLAEAIRQWVARMKEKPGGEPKVIRPSEPEPGAIPQLLDYLNWIEDRYDYSVMGSCQEAIESAKMTDGSFKLDQDKAIIALRYAWKRDAWKEAIGKVRRWLEGAENTRSIKSDAV